MFYTDMESKGLGSGLWWPANTVQKHRNLMYLFGAVCAVIIPDLYGRGVVCRKARSICLLTPTPRPPFLWRFFFKLKEWSK